jgi:hypothetical protein
MDKHDRRRDQATGQPVEWRQAMKHRDARIAELERKLVARTKTITQLQTELARAREAYDPIHLGMLYTARDNASPIYAASIDRAIRWIEQRSALTPAAETENALTTYIHGNKS